MSQRYQCQSFAGLSLTHPVCRLDELLQLWRGVVGGDIAVLVAKQYFPGFQWYPVRRTGPGARRQTPGVNHVLVALGPHLAVHTR